MGKIDTKHIQEQFEEQGELQEEEKVITTNEMSVDLLREKCLSVM